MTIFLEFAPFPGERYAVNSQIDRCRKQGFSCISDGRFQLISSCLRKKTIGTNGISSAGDLNCVSLDFQRRKSGKTMIRFQLFFEGKILFVENGLSHETPFNPFFQMCILEPESSRHISSGIEVHVIDCGITGSGNQNFSVFIQIIRFYRERTCKIISDPERLIGNQVVFIGKCLLSDHFPIGADRRKFHGANISGASCIRRFYQVENDFVFRREETKLKIGFSRVKQLKTFRQRNFNFRLFISRFPLVDLQFPDLEI